MPRVSIAVLLALTLAACGSQSVDPEVLEAFTEYSETYLPGLEEQHIECFARIYQQELGRERAVSMLREPSRAMLDAMQEDGGFEAFQSQMEHIGERVMAECDVEALMAE